MEGDRHTSANRAGCALIAFAYVYSTVFSAIFENSIPSVQPDSFPTMTFAARY